MRPACTLRRIEASAANIGLLQSLAPRWPHCAFGGTIKRPHVAQTSGVAPCRGGPRGPASTRFQYHALDYSLARAGWLPHFSEKEAASLAEITYGPAVNRSTFASPMLWAQVTAAQRLELLPQGPSQTSVDRWSRCELGETFACILGQASQATRYAVHVWYRIKNGLRNGSTSARTRQHRRRNREHTRPCLTILLLLYRNGD